MTNFIAFNISIRALATSVDLDKAARTLANTIHLDKATLAFTIAIDTSFSRFTNIATLSAVIIVRILINAVSHAAGFSSSAGDIAVTTMLFRIPYNVNHHNVVSTTANRRSDLSLVLPYLKLTNVSALDWVGDCGANFTTLISVASTNNSIATFMTPANIRVHHTEFVQEIAMVVVIMMLLMVIRIRFSSFPSSPPPIFMNTKESKEDGD